MPEMPPSSDFGGEVRRLIYDLLRSLQGEVRDLGEDLHKLTIDFERMKAVAQAEARSTARWTGLIWGGISGLVVGVVLIALERLVGG